MLAEFLQFLFSGITVGATYALAALGFTLIYNASNVINFAQGMTILLVEQNALAALDIADRAYVLETGAVTLTGSGQDLINNPQVRAAYLT